MTNINTMLGYKLYKENEDGEFEVYRITSIYPKNNMVRVTADKNCKDMKYSKKIELDHIKDEYSALAPVGLLTFSVVKVGENKDVVVTFSKMIDLKINGTITPVVVCRQSINDFFYTMIATQENHSQVGVSVTINDCPANIGFANMLLCDSIEYSEIVNVYYDDTIDSVLKCIHVLEYNKVLLTLYSKHINSLDPTKQAIFKKRDYCTGWCTNLKQLLTTNNFWIDVDQVLGVHNVDFEIQNYIVEKTDESEKNYYSLTDDTLYFFSKTFDQNITNCIIIEYDYDINLGDYHNESYMMVRDKVNKLYLMVYLTDGKKFEEDIAREKEREHIADQYRLKVYNKYNQK